MVSACAFLTSSAKTKISNSPEDARTSCQALSFLPTTFLAERGCSVLRWASGRVLERGDDAELDEGL